MSLNFTSHNGLLTANPGPSTRPCTGMRGGDVLKFLPHLHSDALVAAQCSKGLPLCTGNSAPLPGYVAYFVSE